MYITTPVPCVTETTLIALLMSRVTETTFSLPSVTETTFSAAWRHINNLQYFLMFQNQPSVLSGSETFIVKVSGSHGGSNVLMSCDAL
jgi:hypothetical protein